MEEIYCFAGNPLDRVSERRRDTGWIASLLDEPATRVIPFRDLKPLIRNGSQMALDWQPVGPWREVINAGATLAFLGIAEARAHFALDATGAAQAPDPATENIDLRTLAPLIPETEAAILAALGRRLARAAPVLHAVRDAERSGVRWLGAALPALQGASFPAGRPGRHHARGKRRARIARPGPPPPRCSVLLSGRLHGAGRDVGRCGPARGA